MIVPSRNKISLGIIVQIVQKQDQRTGKLTEGKVNENSYFKPSSPPWN